MSRRAAKVGAALTAPAGLLLALVLAVTTGVLPLVRTHALTTPAGCAAPHLSGAFVRPDVGPAPATGNWWNQADWSGLARVLHQDCMDQLVLQWTAQTWSGTAPPPGVTDPAWPAEAPPDCLVADAQGRYVQPLYDAADPAWAANAAQPVTGSCGSRPGRSTDQVLPLLTAARAAGIKVWLGLQIDETPWFGTGNSDATWLSGPSYPDRLGGQAQLSAQLAADLWTRYGGEFGATIAGFYLPFEADNEYFPPGSAQMTNYGHYLSAVSGAVHRLPGGGDLGVMIAPVQHSQIGAPPTDPGQRQLRTDWTNTLADWLSGSGVTVLAPQDATGMQTTSPDDLGAWAMAARTAVDRVPGGRNADGLPVQLWSDTEIYSVQGVADMALGRMLADMAATNSAGAGIGTFVAFSVVNLDDTPGHPNARLNSIYHAAYLRYLATGTLPAQGVDPPPGVLSATLAGGSASLRWPVSTGAAPDPAQDGDQTWPVTGYQIFRDGQPIGQLPQPFTDRTGADGFPVPDTGPVEFADPNLQPGRGYSYQVAAFDPFGNLSPLSAAVRVNVPLDTGSAAADPATGVDVAVHKPYAFTDTTVDPAKLGDEVAGHLVPPNGPGQNGRGSYPDAAIAPPLNDGVVGSANDLDPAWSWQPGSAGAFTITTDLGRPQPVNTVRSAWLQESAAGIEPPAAVTVDYSTADQPGAADWRRFGDTEPGLPSGTPNPATPAHTTFDDPGVGWLTTALPAGVGESARWVRLTVTPDPAARWSLVSEVAALGVAGANYTGPAPARSAAGQANFTRPAANCPTSGGCPVVTLDASGPAASGWLRAGLLTDGAPGRYVGWCFPKSTSCPTPSGGNPPGRRFAITVDLGADQPIGRLVTSWAAQAPPAAVNYAYRSEDSGWVDAGTVPGPTSRTGALADFGTTVPPAMARWVRAVITLPAGPGWLLAVAFHAYTPLAVTPTQNQQPLIYPTAATINYAYDPGRPIDPDTNNPTTPAPGLPATPAVCAAAPGSAPCHATDPGPLAGVLTGLDPVTGRPYRGDPAAWPNANSHWVDLSGSPGYDIVIPGTGSPTEILVHFLQDGGAAIGLPATVDCYVTGTPDPLANPAADSWTWTRDTVTRPNLPPYLPDAATLTWTYTAAVPAADAPVTAIRLHINAYRGQHVFLDRAGAYAWAAQ